MSDSLKNCQPTVKNYKIAQRWVTVCCGFLGIFNAFSMRSCLSMAITEMTLHHRNSLFNDSDHLHIENNTTKHSNVIRYDWSEKTQGLILSSFYWGYIVSCVVSGIICQKFGGKHTLGYGVLFTSIFTLLIPYCTYWGGATALIILRIAVGFGEGTTFPAVIHLLAQWIPEDERSKAGFLVFNGSSMGTIFGMFLSGIILEHSKSGWPMVFYFFGIVGLLSFLVHTAFCYARPDDNPYISDEELTYLKNKLGKPKKNLPPIPWRHILKSPEIWACIIAKLGFGWGFNTIANDMPKYMSTVLQFSPKDSGYWSSISYLGKIVCSYVGSWIADKVILEKILSITAVRKIGYTVASFGPAIFFVAASYAGSDVIIVVVLQSIGIALMSCVTFSIMVNSLDLSPNYASSITGLGNGIGVISGAASPYIVGVLTPNQTLYEWRLVFWIVGAIFVASDLVFLIYGSGELQEWNDPTLLNNKDQSNENRVEKGTELLPLNKL